MGIKGRSTWKCFFTLISHHMLKVFRMFLFYEHPRNIFHTLHMNMLVFFVWNLLKPINVNIVITRPLHLVVFQHMIAKCVTTRQNINITLNNILKQLIQKLNISVISVITSLLGKMISSNMWLKAVHEGINYQCEYCSHKASTPNNLHQHVKYFHEGIKYHCDYYNYKTWDLSVNI